MRQILRGGVSDRSGASLLSTVDGMADDAAVDAKFRVLGAGKSVALLGDGVNAVATLTAIANDRA